MTPKDISILTALDSYHSLDTEQIAFVMLSSTRTCQMRVKSLRENGAIIRWLTIEPPGWIRRQSVLVLVERSARLLARQTVTPHRPGVRGARDAVVYSAQLQPKGTRLTGSSEEGLIAQADALMGSSPSYVWRSPQMEKWVGPPAVWLSWGR